ncbi:hypothetical protein EVAR_72617_1 [Eumeta japonica]|uniref:Uncharacterized protein n=1 Tax=Eumeta variegata TaxID=151549 RepID=A0A4C2AEL9_EUMVA|nr:hypothetical protein EVAR_72617_1 [Eumeta japonica]
MQLPTAQFSKSDYLYNGVASVREAIAPDISASGCGDVGRDVYERGAGGAGTAAGAGRRRGLGQCAPAPLRHSTSARQHDH